MATPTQTSTAAEQKRTVEEKIQKIRELFADAPELGRRALENVLGELTSQVSEPKRSMLAPAGRAQIWRCRGKCVAMGGARRRS
jgi:hypothetical protein